MTIQAVVFDIGGVLEITPRLGLEAQWEADWGLEPGELDKRLYDVWKDGSVGTITEAQVHEQIGEILGLEQIVVDAFMADVWAEYLGTLNVELADYFRTLHGPYQTAIISNSFVGAREREEELYGFSELTDFIVYSHEVGVSKPKPEIYEMACGRLGLAPEEVVFLDDSQACVDGASAVGMTAIVFQDNAQAIADIEEVLRG